MPMMHPLLMVLTIIGALFALVLAIAIFGTIINGLRDWRHEPHARSFYEGRCAVWNEVANDAWWFSEDPATMRLLQDLSGVGRQTPMGVSEARERWRKARESSGVAK